MYKHLLVPLDGSEHASVVLPHVCALARNTGAVVTLLRVLPGSVPALNISQSGANDVHLPETPIDQRQHTHALQHELEVTQRGGFLDNGGKTQYASEAAQQYLDAVAKSLNAQGIKAHTMIRPGAVAETILDTALDLQADLIAITTHGRGGLGRFLLGSIADRIIHHTPLPVLLVRSHGQAPSSDAAPIRYQRILVPLDNSELSNTILQPVMALSKCTGASALLVRVVPEPVIEAAKSESSRLVYGVLSAMEHPEGRPAELPINNPYNNQVTYEMEAAQTGLDAAADVLRKADVPVETTVQLGQPATAILDLAASSSIDMIAMSTRGHSGITRFLLGSVADRVLRHADKPILLLRPG